ncbi:MAG: hypothetical protein KAH84_11335, partial [Thiomargarita sp.]|nr:hypothetical protein [Thiomargarita sp.]
MKKYYMIPLIAIIGLIFITETIFAESKNCKLTNLPKIAATHYTGKSFAPDFWGRMDLTEVQNDLKIIKAAGFNSVILVIPWIGFQPNTKPIQYNEQYITYLHTLMLETKKLS